MKKSFVTKSLKSLVSLFLITAIIFSFSVTAFAEGWLGYAEEIELDTTYTEGASTLDCNGDCDVFKFTVPIDGTITLNVESDSFVYFSTWDYVGGADVVYRIYSSNDVDDYLYYSYLQEWDYSSARDVYYGSESFILPKGTYYLVVEYYDSECYKSTYDFELEFKPTIAKPTIKSIENTSSGVKLTWGKLGKIDKYVIYRKAGSSSYKKLVTLDKKTTSYTDKSVKSGTKYSYKIRAYAGDYHGSFSSVKSIVFLSKVKVSSATSSKSGITVKWGKVSGAKGYYVYRKTGSGSYKKLATVKSGSTVKYLDKSAKKGKTYTYYVKAYNGSYTGYKSNTVKCKDKYWFDNIKIKQIFPVISEKSAFLKLTTNNRQPATDNRFDIL